MCVAPAAQKIIVTKITLGGSSKDHLEHHDRVNVPMWQRVFWNDSRFDVVNEGFASHCCCSSFAHLPLLPCLDCVHISNNNITKMLIIEFCLAAFVVLVLPLLVAWLPSLMATPLASPNSILSFLPSVKRERSTSPYSL